MTSRDVSRHDSFVRDMNSKSCFLDKLYVNSCSQKSLSTFAELSMKDGNIACSDPAFVWYGGRGRIMSRARKNLYQERRELHCCVL